jgi:hypothetical protein
MTTPSLFDVLDAPTQRQVVNRRRDVAMQRVADHAAERRRDFLDAAVAFVTRYLAAHGPTSGEVLSSACKAAGIVPHDDRAFGPVYFRLARRGAIQKVGTVRRERGNGTSGGNVWALTRSA